MTKIKMIPKFATLAEEAKFWDTHDVTSYLGEMKEVGIEFIPKEKKEVVTIRLQPSLKERLEKIAQAYGLTLSTLARIWLIEKLRKTEKI